jgi:hypothetical protein
VSELPDKRPVGPHVDSSEISDWAEVLICALRAMNTASPVSSGLEKQIRKRVPPTLVIEIFEFRKRY